MNHAQLRAFHAVAENRGFSAAAKKIGLTQPALTLQVQALEQNYNTKLFKRRGRRIDITSSGEMLLNLSRRIFSLEAEAHTLLSSFENLKIGNLKIAAASSLQALPFAAAFTEKYPAIQLSFKTASPRQINEEILDYRADIALQATFPADKRYYGKKVIEEKLKIAVSTNHPWCYRPSASLQDLEDQRVIMAQTDVSLTHDPDHWGHHIKTKENGDILFESREISREAVANNLGVSFFTDREVLGENRIHLIEIEDKNLKSEVFVVCLAERREARIISEFIDAAVSSQKDPRAF